MKRDDIRAMPLEGSSVRLTSGEEVRQLDLISVLGSGAKGQTWRAIDKFGVIYAVKFVPKTVFKEYSALAEAHHAASLGNDFAKVYGCFDCSSKGDENSQITSYYAILMEFVDGITIKDFLAKDVNITADFFMRFLRAMTAALMQLARNGVCHNDLHGENIMILNDRGTQSLVKIIDTGQIKKLEKRDELVSKWHVQIATIKESRGDPEKILHFERLVSWNDRRDHEWVAFHLVELFNKAYLNSHMLSYRDRRFFESVPGVISRIVDDDLSLRLSDPTRILEAFVAVLNEPINKEPFKLYTPFDYMSAEFFRSDSDLRELFSEQCPWYQDAFSPDPLYIYGPRGCGKSSLLRMLSIRTQIDLLEQKWAIEGVKFIGVYISCVSELRSRFLYYPEDDAKRLSGSCVRYFSLVLIANLIECLEYVISIDSMRGNASIGISQGVTRETIAQLTNIVRPRCLKDGAIITGLPDLGAVTRHELSRIWGDILAKKSDEVFDPTIVVEFCRVVESAMPFVARRPITFLLDDYSDQRIPNWLQRILNQTISFSRSRTPIFKVSSEYNGVDLSGINQSREVREINIGAEFNLLDDPKQVAFYEDIIDIRLKKSGKKFGIRDLLGVSDIKPGIGIARERREKRQPKYSGVQIIAATCSGDIATAISITRSLYLDSGAESLVQAKEIDSNAQDAVCRSFSNREHKYINYNPPHGHEVAKIIGQLCWLASECAEKCLSRKDGVDEPMMKTHMDIPERVLLDLQISNPDKFILFQELIRRGALVNLMTSRSRIENNNTERFQIRKILLVSCGAPLGRRDPIKIDNLQSLLFLITDPEAFVKRELKTPSPSTGTQELLFPAG